MSSNKIIFYTTPQGDVRVEIFFEEETFWLTQKKMSDLFDKDTNTLGST